MKRFLSAILFFAPTIASAMLGDSIPNLEIGKRTNWLFSPSIRPENVARWEITSTRIFFRSDYQPDYQPIGFMGERIKPYFAGNASAQTSFEKFQQNRKWGIACQVGGIAVGVYTMVNFFKMLGSALGAESDKSSGVKAAIGFIINIGLGIEYRILSVKSERHLLEAVHAANGFPAKSTVEPKMDASFGLSSDQLPGLALRLRF